MSNPLSKIFKTKTNMIGLDLGSSYVKCMEISGDSLDSMKIVNYSIEPIPKNLIGDNGKFEQVDQIAEIVKKCWKNLNTSVKNVAVALPFSSGTYKKISMPIFDSESDMQMQVENEVGKFLPNGVSISEMAFDYYVVDQNEEIEGENNILMVASKKETIDERLAVIEMAGLVPIVLDVETYSYQNLLRIMKGEEFLDGVYVLVDCSGYSLRMMVYKNGELFYTKDNQIGGFNFTQELSSNYSSSIEDAEKLKIERTAGDGFEVLEKQFVDNYAIEFVRLFSYFTSATSINEIKEVILVGGASSMHGLDLAVRDALLDAPDIVLSNQPYVAKPFEDISKNPKLSLTKLARDESGLFLVASLAMRKLLRDF